MYKIINQSQRSFTVRAEDVVSGGIKGHKTNERIIEAGPNVVEVSDTLGRTLKGYAGILVIEEVKKGK